jgi:signal transduction histidine kinase
MKRRGPRTEELILSFFRNEKVGGFSLRLGTRLAIFLSVVIVTVLSGYGYFHIRSRQDILVRKMKVEVKGIGETLRVSLEKLSLPREMEYVQNLIDAVEESEKTLSVIVYHPGKNIVFQSRTLGEGTEPYLELIKKSIQEGRPQEKFTFYKKYPFFSYTFPLKDNKGRNIGGVSVLQNTSDMEEDVRKAKESILVIILVLIGGTVTLVLSVTRRWIFLPISQLMDGIQNMAKGDLKTRIDLKRKDELFDLAQAFNQMAVDLRKAQERIVRDAESRLELERSLQQSEKLATIGQLSSGLAHEIGTPLNIISGRAELLKRRFEDQKEAQKNLDIIVQQSERITKIIQQLLGFVRKKNPKQIPIHVSAILENTLDFLDHQIQKQEVRVNKDLEDNLLLVKGDSDQLQQVFLNLILNAIQSMPKGGELHLSTHSKWCLREGMEEDQRRYVEVRVEDTGMGMQPEVLQKIFNPFYTTKDKGTGLGLTVSLGIVQDHEGWIDVKSELGEGSLFTVYLPVLEGEKKSVGSEASDFGRGR